MDSESTLAGADQLDRASVVRLAGVLDLGSAADLERRLERAIDEAGERDITVDFTAVTFMDATAMRVIVEATRDGSNRGASVVLRNLHPFHRRLFDIAGDAERLTISA